MEDRGSDFAAEGTLAHAVCAMKLKSSLGLPTAEEEGEISGLKDDYWSGEMEEYTDVYKSIVLEKLHSARLSTRDAQLLVETRLDFGRYIPDAFGTADAVIIADGTMEVIDFKYGRGVKVQAFENPQMMIYALGAYERFSFDYDIRDIRMTIVQPRIDNLSEYGMTAADLLEWAKTELAPKAELAYRGGGPQVPGAWCRFCKVRNSCRALSGFCTGTAGKYPDPKLIGPDELAKEVLPVTETVKMWLAGVEDYALQLALSGVRLPGWKLVEGRSIRRITDPDGAAEALSRAGFRPEDFYRPQELRTLTDLEKMAGKKRFAEICGGCIEKPKGKPVLVPEDDRRPAIDPAAEDFKDIDL